MGGRLSPLFLEFEMKMKKETFWGWLLITPLTLGLTLWVAFPVGVAVFMSLFKWNMISPRGVYRSWQLLFYVFSGSSFLEIRLGYVFVHIDERSPTTYFGFLDGAPSEYEGEGYGNFPNHLLFAVADPRNGIDRTLALFV